MVNELPDSKLSHPVDHLETSEVHDCLDENSVITYVRILAVELGEWTKKRTATGDVHFAHRSLEGGGGDVGSEGVDDVLPVALVQQHQSHLKTEEDDFSMYIFLIKNCGEWVGGCCGMDSIYT